MVVEDMQQNDIFELVDKAMEWESMMNQVMAIKAFLGLNKESSSTSAKGNSRDTIKDQWVELANVKA